MATTHGKTRTPEYRCWAAMLHRCDNPRSQSYPYYGGRGIKVCDRWRDFAAFIEDMGPRPSKDHTLDRINNDGPYSPENCRWATRREQVRNTRAVRYVEWRGEQRALVELCEEYGISYPAVKARIGKLGWSLEDALTRPTQINQRLTEDDAREIRRRYAEGEGSAALAKAFGISAGHARSILCGIRHRTT